MKKTLTAFFAGMFLHILSVHAQTLIKGQVREKEQHSPVAKASVILSDGRQTLSDDEGWFVFRVADSGQYSIRISSIGYKTLEVQVSAGQFNRIFLMERSTVLMQPVEILAVRAGERAPFTKTTIGKNELSKNNLGQDLPFLLNQTPSVVVNSDAGNGVGYTGILIRGTDATRINLTLNGIPYNDAESQGLFFVNLPDFSSSVNSIQVQRGVGTSSNGSGAFGATINMSTNEVQENAYTEINNSYGSFNTWKNTFKAGTGLLNNQFTVDARLSHISSDGYIDRASTKLYSWYVSGAWLKENTSLRFNSFSGSEKTYQAWYGIPEEMLTTNRTYNPAGTEKPGEPYDNETDNYKQDHYQLFFNHRFNQRLSLNAALFYTRGKGYYEQYKAEAAYADYGISGQPPQATTDLVRQLWLDNHYFGNIFSLQYKDEKNEAILGGGYNRYLGDHYGKVIWASNGSIPKDHRWYNLDAFKNDLNLYVKYQRKIFDGLYLFGDLQYKNVKYDLNGFRNSPNLIIRNNWNFFNPKVGVSYNRKDWTTFISYAVANKEPNRDDFEAGLNQQPRHETLHDMEAGFEKRNPVYGWGITGYYMRYRNQLVLTGMINDVGAYTRTNIPESYRIGIELHGRWKPLNWFNAAGNLSLSENKVLNFTEYYDDYDNGGQKWVSYKKTDISFSPALTSAASLNFLPVKGWELSLTGKYVSRQYLDNTSNKTRSLDPYFLTDFRTIHSIPQKWAKDISVIFQLNNLFDVKYEPNGYSYSYQYNGELITSNNYFPMAGRNFMVGVNVRL